MAPAVLLVRTPKNVEAERLLRDDVTAATELRHQNGDAALTVQEHCVMPVDFVRTFPTLSGYADIYIRLCKIDAKDGLKAICWILEPATERIESSIALSCQILQSWIQLRHVTDDTNFLSSITSFI